MIRAVPTRPLVCRPEDEEPRFEDLSDACRAQRARGRRHKSDHTRFVHCFCHPECSEGSLKRYGTTEGNPHNWLKKRGLKPAKALTNLLLRFWYVCLIGPKICLSYLFCLPTDAWYCPRTR